MGYRHLSFPLLLGCNRDGDRGDDRDDGPEVDEDNSEVGGRLVVFPLVHGDDNGKEHISGVIDPLCPIPSPRPRPRPRLDCRNRVDGDNNEEEHISGVIDLSHSLHRQLRWHPLVNGGDNTQEHM